MHLPIIGERSRSVLMPIDFEIFLGDENYRLYSDKDTQKRYFEGIVPVADFIEQIFRSRGMPYLLDYTPSGGHFLFQNQLGERATQALVDIGYLEDDLVNACNYIDPHDLRRKYGVALDAARVFSGLGKLAEYIALLTMEAFRDNGAKGLYPVTISDSLDRCINLDNTWNGRVTVYALHTQSRSVCIKKTRKNMGTITSHRWWTSSGRFLMGTPSRRKKAGRYSGLYVGLGAGGGACSKRLAGTIPSSNETLIDFIREYQRSDLYAFHQDFDRETDMRQG